MPESMIPPIYAYHHRAR